MKILKGVMEAAALLGSASRGLVKDPEELFAIARQVYPEWKKFDQWLIFKVSAWMDGSTPSIHTEATFRIGGHELARKVLLLQRAEAARWKFPVTYRMLLHVEHHEHHGVVCWIDAETGAVRKTGPWRHHVDGEERAPIPADGGSLALTEWLLSLGGKEGAR